MYRTSAFFALFLATTCYAADVQLPSPPDFMVTGSIAGYTPRGASPVGVWRTLQGALNGRGRVPGRDYSYDIAYFNSPRSVLVYVDEVENSRWMTHEVETHFRTKAEQWNRHTREEKKRYPPYSFEIRMVYGQRIFFGADGEYVWTSGPNRVVQIGWGRQMDRPDGTYENFELPDEFLTTYLGLLPSNVPDIRFDVAHEQAYVRDEFDRDFEYVAYYMEQWTAHGAAPGRDEYAPASGRLRHIRDQRSKYFGGDSTDEWERKLVASIEHRKPEDQKAGYAQTETLAFWQAQYDELKGWWDQHHNDPINVEPIRTH
jgi:hypothetical protein